MYTYVHIHIYIHIYIYTHIYTYNIHAYILLLCSCPPLSPLKSVLAPGLLALGLIGRLLQDGGDPLLADIPEVLLSKRHLYVHIYIYMCINICVYTIYIYMVAPPH